MKAPPLRPAAPAALTLNAVWDNISRFSTEQGPAITTNPLAPTVPSPNGTIVGPALNSELASL